VLGFSGWLEGGRRREEEEEDIVPHVHAFLSLTEGFLALTETRKKNVFIVFF